RVQGPRAGEAPTGSLAGAGTSGAGGEPPGRAGGIGRAGPGAGVAGAVPRSRHRPADPPRPDGATAWVRAAADLHLRPEPFPDGHRLPQDGLRPVALRRGRARPRPNRRGTARRVARPVEGLPRLPGPVPVVAPLPAA